MTEPTIATELAAAILALFRGPYEEFVSRRDALVKQLRAAKQREDADRVKALRKPSRMAWVLDNIVHEDPASIERLAAAIKTAQTDADVRLALATVKAAVRDVAAVGTRVALRAGQPVDPNAVIAALHAVIGSAGAFADMRAGRLVEVPEAGGLDMLVATTVRELPEPTSAPSPASRVREQAVDDAPVRAAKQNAELAKAARADLQRAEVAFATMRERSEHSAKVVLGAQMKLDVAERALLHAQSEAQARRADLERFQDDAQTTAAALKDAEQAVAAARARVTELGG